MPDSGDENTEAMRAQVDALNDEIAHLRTRMADAPKRVRALEERLLETKGQLAQAVSQNEKLTYTLREARDHIAALREEEAVTQFVEDSVRVTLTLGEITGRMDEFEE